MKKQEKRKNKVLNIILIIAILALIIALAGYAYAKYMSSIKGNASADIARWKIKVNGETEESFTIELASTRAHTVQEAEVQDGYIGPGTSGVFEIIVDADETDVSLEYDINMKVDYNNNEKFPKNLIFYSDSQMKNAIYHTNTVVNLKGYIAQSDSNRVKSHIIYWKWDFETGQTQKDREDNDVADSYWIGRGISIPITVICGQVNQNPMENKCEVTFDANGGVIPEYGNAGIMTKTLTYNEAYGNLPIPVRNGYKFIGWNGKNLFDQEKLLMNIDGAKYQNGYYVFNLGRATAQYGSGFNGLVFKENTIYSLTINGHLEYANSDKACYCRIFFHHTDGTEYYQYFNATEDVSLSYSSYKGKTVDYIGITYAFGGTAYISSIQLEEGAPSTEFEPYYINQNIMVTERIANTLKAIWKSE